MLRSYNPCPLHAHGTVDDEPRRLENHSLNSNDGVKKFHSNMSAHPIRPNISDPNSPRLLAAASCPLYPYKAPAALLRHRGFLPAEDRDQGITIRRRK